MGFLANSVLLPKLGSSGGSVKAALGGTQPNKDLSHFNHAGPLCQVWGKSHTAVVIQVLLHQNMHNGDFPDGPVVKTPRFHAGGTGSIRGWETKIPHAERP